jgi:hypothetical protein
MHLTALGKRAPDTTEIDMLHGPKAHRSAPSKDITGNI